MFNPDFYPTPRSLAIKMAGMISHDFSRRILEPSAGKGDLVEAVNSRMGRGFNSRIDCIESEIDLQATLTGKGYKVIDDDFLAYQPSKQYDTIIMNPPFSNGVKHVLKAWEILYSGDVIAILNAETIRNDFSAERKLLNEIITNNGTIEFIENAFIDAERKTGVEVALIKLSKRNSIKADYFDGLETAKEVEEINTKTSELAIPESTIANMVYYFDMAVKTKTEAIIASEKAAGYSGFFLGRSKDETASVKDNLSEFVDTLRIAAWRNVTSLTEFRKLLTEKLRKEFDANSEVIQNLEFTEKNIRKYLKNLLLNSQAIIDDCTEDLFDKLTRFHDDNRVHVEGWKSNDYFFVNKRVVLPYISEVGYSGEVRLHYTAHNTLDDMDRVMSSISGKREFLSIYDSISKYQAEHKDCANAKIESEFFTVRMFKKGTAHFYFNDLKLLEQFNLIVGRKKRWLPKEDSKVDSKFWLINGVAA